MLRSIYTTIILLFAAITIYFSSCETMEDIVDFPVEDPSLVVNCFFASDSLFRIQVSKSLSIIDNADLEVFDEATIKIFEDDNLIETLNKTNFNTVTRHFESASMAKSGSTYKLEVSKYNFETISIT